jgi:hypothetical protein
VARRKQAQIIDLLLDEPSLGRRKSWRVNFYRNGPPVYWPQSARMKCKRNAFGVEGLFNFFENR